ncbi:adenylyltransferase/sulfurtransferase [Thermosporothrix hazakensis]|jgi:rhodanese-related sulfurtransferase|uniref:Adenylyltransferase/sulfurtransferase n=2 Tax=Thermosporothrix TaxID=768650 RepID=A0A326TZL8_THEHA|nr:rhodanese-like domain-containing protein [Thermosporothrix hazakensis]PZW22900.1 adenylyltransferase/sulfurtransferase [Thermosporothrix hazakensis]BBH89819.1 rhodanese-like domain-containing protein [Thermosporothrix sp. COM3]GCE48008.1 rhodanese-like domain-containing protein [Thermosporothrix hazakensis]
MAYEEQEAALPYTTISTEQAKQMIETGAHVVDVREPEEWQSGHIAQAQLVPINSKGIYLFGKALEELHLPTDKEVIFVCRSGHRSSIASEIASLLGFQKVYNLANGMIGWLDHRYPVER